MRLLIDSMILAMVLVILIGAVAYRYSLDRQDEQLVVVQEGLDRFQDRLEFHSALWMAQEGTVGNYPPQIMPHWFEQALPQNSLIAGKRPWLDIAPVGDYNDHPPDPLADGEQAAFWYNPERGIIRARVPQQGTDRMTLELYNRVNGTSLASLANEPDPERMPIAFNPNPTTSGQHASLNRQTVGQVEALDKPVVEPAATEDSQAQAQEPVPWWDKSNSKQADPPKSDPAADAAPARPSLIAP